MSRIEADHLARAGALEKRERPLVSVEHHLLRLARIGAHEHHPAVAEADVRDLHRRRHAVQHDDLVAPVELVGLARREGQRDEGVSAAAEPLAHRKTPSPPIAGPCAPCCATASGRARSP